MRLIDADALEKRMEERLKALTKECGYYDGYTCGFEEGCVAVEDAPTIDPESLRPKGEWIDNHCSVCGMMPMGEELWESCDFAPPKFEWFMDFCPNCGADMRGDNDEKTRGKT